MKKNSPLFEHFNLVSDPRMDRTKRYKLIDILIITICGVLSDCDCWTDIVDWGEENEKWLEKYLGIENGIPSHDTFGRVFSILKPDELHRAFYSWVNELKGNKKVREIINIDGKFLNGTKSFDDSRNALIIVSAWAVESGITLAQLSSRLKKDEGEKKTTEKILDCIEVKGNIITLDAMGATPNILNKIVDKGGDHVVSIKNNQRKIKTFIDKFMNMNQDLIELKTVFDDGHGRKEERRYEFIQLSNERTLGLNQLKNGCFGRFKKISGLGKVTSTRKKNGIESSQTRYFMSTLGEIDEFATAIRSHWSIENNLHWQMDVTFREDEQKAKLGYVAENLAGIRRFALGLINQETTEKKSKRRKRRLCLMRKSYLLKVILGDQLSI